ncbi:MAG: Lar family restriction alleviation protein [Eubacteriales bacterium]
MTEKLKPCPFCGGEASLYEYNRVQHSVECDNCKVGQPIFTTEVEAWSKWNTRTTNWNKYPEVKPEDRQSVLIVHDEGDDNLLPHELPYYYVAWYDQMSNMFWGRPEEDEFGNENEPLFLGKDVTHWQPLPEPPEEVAHDSIAKQG